MPDSISFAAECRLIFQFTNKNWFLHAKKILTVPNTVLSLVADFFPR